MEENWGRQLDFVHLATPQLTELIQIAFPGQSVTQAELLTAGHYNTNYKLFLSSEHSPIVLRLYLRNQEACQKDLDLFQLISSQVPLPTLFYAQPTPISFPGLSEPITYALSSWVEGTLLSEILSSSSLVDITSCAYAVGSTLASINHYTFPQAGFFGSSLTIAQPFSGAPYLDSIYASLSTEPAHLQLGKTLLQQIHHFVTTNASYLSCIETASHLVHADYKGINILLRQQAQHWQVSAVLDWEFAFSGSPLIDIGNMLRYQNTLPPAFRSSFLQGYQDFGGTLPSHWEKSARLVDMLSLCQFISHPHQSPALVADITALLISTMNSWPDL